MTNIDRILRILIDQDGVLYDLNTPWYQMHNNDYGHIHIISYDTITQFDVSDICKAHNCPANLYTYFNKEALWKSGRPIANSVEITQAWAHMYELGIVTVAVSAAAYAPKHEWLSTNYPHIENIMMVNTSIKPWVQGDILIDDGIHNHVGFEGISILFNQPWNIANKTLPRAQSWLHLANIVNRADDYIRYAENKFGGAVPYKQIQELLKHEINIGQL